MKRAITLTLLSVCFLISNAFSQEKTYAEKLGFPKDARVLILHVDDVGMSWDSNQGAIQAIEKGVATSFSIMMPCPWVPGIAHYLKKNPKADAGLHLTLTSEWTDYRWHPLTGRTNVGLVDGEGAFWSSVEDVVKHATADEVEAEIRAQIERARNLGIEPTHLDSHMGTLFATNELMKRYVKVGIENKIPVMLPAGHLTLISAQFQNPQQKQQVQAVGEMLWASGLPVLDDLHNLSYGFQYPKDISDADLQKAATKQYKETIKALKPGLTMVIMHCTAPSEIFPFITDSNQLRKADLLAMTDPEFKKFLQDEKIILTTWREVKERREKAK
jgi:chitin disaccharide deacetylase